MINIGWIIKDLDVRAGGCNLSKWQRTDSLIDLHLIVPNSWGLRWTFFRLLGWRPHVAAPHPDDDDWVKREAGDNCPTGCACTSVPFLVDFLLLLHLLFHSSSVDSYALLTIIKSIVDSFLITSLSQSVAPFSLDTRVLSMIIESTIGCATSIEL